MYSFSVRVESKVLDNLIAAAYTGCTYWSRRRFTSDNGSFEVTESDGGLPVKPGWHTIDRNHMLVGLQVAARESPMAVGRVLANKSDATDADIVLQCGLFGKLIYG